MIISMGFIKAFLIPQLSDEEMGLLSRCIVGTTDLGAFDVDLTALPFHICQMISRANRNLRETNHERDQQIPREVPPRGKG